MEIIELAARAACAYATSCGDLFTINRFGESGPANKVAEHLGFTAQKLAERLK
ncbi:MAG: hypothetical protein J1E59_04190 [Treponema sp.]|nr:hypothetical protein [Treponema sp.]